MAPMSLDRNADATIFVVQKDGPHTKRRIEVRVLTAALEQNSYWKKFIEHANANVGFRSNKEYVEDTGISATAVEIVLRALHASYHANLKKPEACHQGKTVGQDGEAEKGKQQAMATGSGGGDGSVTNDLQELDEAFTQIGIEARSGNQDSIPPINHGNQPADLVDHFTKDLFEVFVDDVWAVLPLINFKNCGVDHKGKLDVDRELLLPWFLKWRQTSLGKFKEQLQFECLIFPTFAFDDAEGWSDATKWLCHNTKRGQISEYSPLVFSNDAASEWYRNLHLPKEVIARIRVARSQIYTRLEDHVWFLTRNTWFAKGATCACRVVAAYHYRKALQDAGALEGKTIKGRRGEADKFLYSDRIKQNKTIVELADCLDKVTYEEAVDPCATCAGVHVQSILVRARGAAMDFQGLCLDCMEASLDEEEDPHLRHLQRFLDYRDKFDRQYNLCRRCRVRHGRASWHFSWVNPISRQSIFPPPKGGIEHRGPSGLGIWAPLG